MFRIDDPSAAAALPTPEAAGTEGYFTEGNPGSGIPATLVRGSFLNMVQEELRAVVVAAGLTPSKTTYNQLLTAIKAVTIGRLQNIQVFSTAGTFTYTPTAGTTRVVVRVQGGGGGGGGTVSTAAGNVAGGTGGSAGAYAESLITSAFSGVTVTVGAGGAGVAGANGGTGGTSSFGALVSSPGGTGGAAAAGAVPPSLLGGTQPSAVATGGNIFNGSGAAGAGSIYATTTAFVSGLGGSSLFGAGGGPSGTVNNNGNNGTGRGSGGGGATAAVSNPASQTGGNGAPGIVIVEEYS